jgi:hypothetical protein
VANFLTDFSSDLRLKYLFHFAADLLTHLRGHNEQDLLECIDWSVSSVKNEPRFGKGHPDARLLPNFYLSFYLEVKLSNGQTFVRATYGHSFVTVS